LKFFAIQTHPLATFASQHERFGRARLAASRPLDGGELTQYHVQVTALYLYHGVLK